MKPFSQQETHKLPEVIQLYIKLGFVDPHPGAGRWNKKARKDRQKALDAIKIKKYLVGYVTYDDGGAYYKRPVYEHEGQLYHSYHNDWRYWPQVFE